MKKPTYTARIFELEANSLIKKGSFGHFSEEKQLADSKKRIFSIGYTLVACG